MWFCDAKHIIAVVTDHWACFKDVPGEQSAEAFAEAVGFGKAARVCAARVHQVFSREYAQPPLRK